MTIKRLLNPRRRRKVPSQFSWVDHRLVRDGHIGRASPEALALYLFLLTVGDADGLSYYSDAKAAGLLSMSPAQLAAARGNLIGAGLIAWSAPLYQVLDLQPPPETSTPLPASSPSGPSSIAEILGLSASPRPEGGEA